LVRSSTRSICLSGRWRFPVSFGGKKIHWWSERTYRRLPLKTC